MIIQKGARCAYNGDTWNTDDTLRRWRFCLASAQMRANSRRCARTGGGAASTPIVDAASLLVRALFRFPSPAKLPATQADKDPNNALDPTNSEVQLIETIINTERCVKGVAHLIYLP